VTTLPVPAADVAAVAAGTAVALVRAAAVAAIAVTIGERLAAALRRLPAGRLRTAAIALTAVPFVVPALVQGYAYSQTSLSLVRWPALLEAWYALLLVVRLAPVAALVAFLAPPPPLSASAAHCARLLPRPRAPQLAATALPLLLARSRNRIVAGAVVFAAAFTEFEVAALSSVRSWTVALFQAHAGGLAGERSALLATAPALVQLAVIAGGLAAVRSWGRATTRGAARAAPPVRSSSIAWAYAAAAAGLGGVLPIALLAAEGGGVPELPWAQLARELGWSLWFALPAAAAAWWLAGRVLRDPARRWAWCLPGLCGALILGLAVLGLFQLPGVARLHDTPLPLLLAHTLLLLPSALLLRGALRGRERAASHLARLLGDGGSGSHRRAAAHLGWQLRGRPQALLWGVLLFGGLFEVTAAALLHPVTTTPAAVRLYNLMHYGHGAVLSAMVLAMIVAGAVVLAVVVWAPGVAAGALARAGARGGPP
jgi:hypothetical protein